MLILFYFGSCRVVSESRTLWSEKVQLTQKDFNGPVNNLRSQKGKAWVGIGSSYDVKYNGSLKNLKVWCFFDDRKSFLRDTSRYILLHEIGHFNIGEIYARKIRQSAKEHFQRNRNLSENKFNEMFDFYYQEFLAFQENYDLGTTMPYDSVQQQQWNLAISKNLRELKNFKGIRIKLR